MFLWPNLRKNYLSVCNVEFLSSKKVIKGLLYKLHFPQAAHAGEGRHSEHETVASRTSPNCMHRRGPGGIPKHSCLCSIYPSLHYRCWTLNWGGRVSERGMEQRPGSGSQQPPSPGGLAFWKKSCDNIVCNTVQQVSACQVDLWASQFCLVWQVCEISTFFYNLAIGID